MKYIDAEKLKEKIEKRREFHDDAVIKFCNIRTIALTHSAGLKEDEELIELIDSLQQEQPEVDLKEAAEEWCKINNKGIALCADKKSHYLAEGVDAFIAGAEWMEKEINKELIKAMEKVHEIGDVNYDIHIDTSYM